MTTILGVELDCLGEDDGTFVGTVRACSAAPLFFLRLSDASASRAVVPGQTRLAPFASRDEKEEAMSRLRCCVRGALSLAVLCTSLSAALPVAPAAADAGSAEPPGYRAFVDQGLQEYDAGHFTEARALFWQAYSLERNARVMRCLGMTEFELRNYRDSASWLAQSLGSEVFPLTPELRVETTDLLSRARGFIAQLQLSVAPENTTVVIDGAPSQLVSGGAVLLEAGDHTLTFRAPGYVTQQRVLKARGGDVHTLHVALAEEAPVRRELAPASDPAPVEPEPSRFFVVPRFTLVMPGKGTYQDVCSEELCEEGAVDLEQRYSRNAAPMLGVDLVYAPTPELRVGLGLHMQLNQTTWTFASGYDSEFGRAFWVPAVGEYRIPLRPALELPVRAIVGLSLVRAGTDLKRVGDSANTHCERVREQGGECSVAGPPAAGVIVGVGPGIARKVGTTTLRADVMLGYQWTRLVELEVQDDGASLSDRQTDGTFIAALSVAVEL